MAGRLVLVAACFDGLALAFLVVQANPGPWVSAALAELLVALVYVSLGLNVAFAATAALAWPIARRVLRLDPYDFSRWLVAGLTAAHLAWALWHRMQIAQSWLVPPRVVTPASVGLSVTIAAAATALMHATFEMLRRKPAGLVSLAVGLALAVGGLGWNASWERATRRYGVSEIRAAAPPHQGAHDDDAAARPRVVILGLDGLSWSVLVPLLRAGQLPAFASAASEGALGYLDNGDVSLSPPIWASIFTGHSAERHGVHDFTKAVLPRSGAQVTSFLTQHPAPDAFFALKPLLELMPQPGLWRIERNGPGDRREPALWEVASHHGRVVVVANVLNNVPVRPLNGASIDYRSRDGRHADPRELTRRWAPTPLPAPGEPGYFPARRARQEAEVEFTLGLARQLDADLVVHYDRLVDESAHRGWRLSRDGAGLTAPANTLTDAAWAAVVGREAERPATVSYLAADRLLGRFREALPGSDVVVVSDHGWSFAGNEHYGSPDGVLLLAGPRVRAGVATRNARVLDVLPTAAALLGLPLSRELEGRILVEALRDVPEPPSVASYRRGPRARRADPPEPAPRNRLRALGDVQ